MLLIWIICGLAAAAFFWKWGYNYGKERGHILGWNECYIEKERVDERRKAFGVKTA